MVCFNCDKRGHRKADCPRFGGGAYCQPPGTQEHRNQQKEGSTKHETGSSAVVHNSGALHHGWDARLPVVGVQFRVQEVDLVVLLIRGVHVI